MQIIRHRLREEVRIRASSGHTGPRRKVDRLAERASYAGVEEDEGRWGKAEATWAGEAKRAQVKFWRRFGCWVLGARTYSRI